MIQDAKDTRNVGPLFAGAEIVEKEPEKIWDDNDEDPANEKRWLTYHARHEASITASETEYVTEYKRRRDAARNE